MIHRLGLTSNLGSLLRPRRELRDNGSVAGQFAVVSKLRSLGPQRAVVVIYRDSSFAGSALRPTVMLNGQDFVNIGKLCT